MRVRSIVTIALLLPGALSAQRRTGGRGAGGRIGERPAPPAALPPQPSVIAREMRNIYIRLPISAESYTFIAFSQGPAPTNFGASWSSLAAATRFDYRISSRYSIAAEITQTILSPTPTGTFEFGTRVRPWGSAIESKVRPFMDVRAGYQYSIQSYLYSPDPSAVNPVTLQGLQAGRGFGWVAGAGSEFDITRTLAITTGFWSARSRLRFGSQSAFQTQSATFQPGNTPGPIRWISTSRLALGLKWNPVKAVSVPETP